MFRSDATFSPAPRPFTPNWTIRELLDWIAADDARCHDESLIPVLATSDGTDLTPSSPVALVRALAARVRRDPDLAQTRVSDLRSPVSPAPAA
ncbi:hypothetical protein [Microbacterium sp.]|uniref:hypothetical protein n=1 Tax=Microbacterium sp. TaxID=51671 RepID=UPI0035B39A20